MKNLHLIPTDKPSRLWTNNLRRRLEIDEFPEQHPTNIAKQIFITSDEAIKEGDWCFYLNNLGGGNIVCQAYKHSEDKRMLFDNGKHNRKIGEGITPLMCECKKIILTTDQNLIADGVQAIDDEFLEWFVKNPSCKEVKIGEGTRYEDEWIDNEDGGEIYQHQYCCYKIFIPQEEPQQIKCYCGHTTYCDCSPEEPRDVILGYKTSLDAQMLNSQYVDFSNPNADKISSASTTSMKQETLEKGVDKYFKLSHSRLKNEQQKEYERELFIAGAKWQAERMYSEEEIKNMLIDMSRYFSTKELRDNFESEYSEWIRKRDWFINYLFEQFKKK